MRFSVGYPVRCDREFTDSILANRERIYEVYFAFGDLPSGRSPMTECEGMLPHEATERLLADLSRFTEGGIPLNILFNANCYGKDALSKAFYSRLGDTLDYLAGRFSLRSVTTTSPLIAKFVKENFPALSTRASVNMEIGTVQGMDYQSEWFDGFYLKRECNRDTTAIRRAKAWCDAHGKQLYMLANSGCLNYCSSHIFHDNLVAHEKDIAAMDNGYAFRGTCWDYLAKEEKRVSLVRDANWVRPEDMPLYEGLFTAAKLATRVNAVPARVLEAYVSGKYSGSTLDLLEPNHAGAIRPYYIDNRLFPADFAATVAGCDKNCDACGYCEKVYQKVLVNLEESIC